MKSQNVNKSSLQSLKKRIKKQVVGRGKELFLVCQPGFEDIGYNELLSTRILAEDLQKKVGGIEFNSNFNALLMTNLLLRTATRVLMRICKFSASRFWQLDKEVEKVPWELYFYKSVNIIFHITCHQSKLNHKRGIQERILGSIDKRMGKVLCIADHDHRALPQQLFVRVKKDQFTISLDTSGLALYKRGLKLDVGDAPLRETLASIILSVAGFDGSQILLDPMCGSGSFSLEGAMIAKGIPAGLFREFAFHQWPSFQENRWDYIKKQSIKDLKNMDNPIIFASDLSSKRIRALNACVEKYHLSDAIRITQQDFFDIIPSEISARPDIKGIIVMNPPYGLRLDSRDQSQRLFEEILQKLNKDYKKWTKALILPHQRLISHIQFPHRIFPLKHGGLDLHLIVGKALSND